MKQIENYIPMQSNEPSGFKIDNEVIETAKKDVENYINPKQKDILDNLKLEEEYSNGDFLIDDIEYKEDGTINVKYLNKDNKYKIIKIFQNGDTKTIDYETNIKIDETDNKLKQLNSEFENLQTKRDNGEDVTDELIETVKQINEIKKERVNLQRKIEGTGFKFKFKNAVNTIDTTNMQSETPTNEAPTITNETQIENHVENQVKNNDETYKNVDQIQQQNDREFNNEIKEDIKPCDRETEIFDKTTVNRANSNRMTEINYDKEFKNEVKSIQDKFNDILRDYEGNSHYAEVKNILDEALTNYKKTLYEYYNEVIKPKLQCQAQQLQDLHVIHGINGKN